jgi:hypothetical protein
MEHGHDYIRENLFAVAAKKITLNREHDITLNNNRKNMCSWAINFNLSQTREN